jgi:hypothetical protein
VLRRRRRRRRRRHAQATCTYLLSIARPGSRVWRCSKILSGKKNPLKILSGKKNPMDSFSPREFLTPLVCFFVYVIDTGSTGSRSPCRSWGLPLPFTLTLTRDV